VLVVLKFKKRITSSSSVNTRPDRGQTGGSSTGFSNQSAYFFTVAYPSQKPTPAAYQFVLFVCYAIVAHWSFCFGTPQFCPSPTFAKPHGNKKLTRVISYFLLLEIILTFSAE
jgi:hypothetical protein